MARDPDSTLVDRVKVYVISSGTGAFTLGAAVRAYQGVEVLRDGEIYSYAIESGAQFEIGRGQYVASLTSLTRGPIRSSSGGDAVDFPTNAELAFTALASDLSVVSAYVDAALATGFVSWPDLQAFASQMRPGDQTFVQTGDTGNHTDPATGQSVTNAGVYAKQAGYDDPVWLYPTLDTQAAERAEMFAGFDTLADALTFAPKMATGETTTVERDTGTHVAVAGEIALGGAVCVGGETIPNNGGYAKQASGTPLLWRAYDTLDQKASAQADRAEDAATEALEIVGDLGTLVEAVDDAASSAAASLLYKQQAEAVALPLPALADQVTADRAVVAAARTDTLAARDAAQQVVYNIIPIAQSALMTSNYTVVVGYQATPGTGTSADPGVVIGSNAGLGNDSRKLHAIGMHAGRNYSGYAPALFGVFAGRDSAANHTVAIGTHAFQSANKLGRTVYGFGALASGLVTLTGLPNDGDTVGLNAVVFTARAAPATAYEFAIGADAAATAANLFAKVAAATDDALRDACYRLGTGANTNRLELIATGRGAWGNAYTLATSSGSVALSAATLAGGTDYANATLSAGGVAQGFLAYAFAEFGAAKPAHGWLTFVSNPADGDTLIVGNNNATITFKTTPTLAMDVQIGADATATAVNTLAVLRAQASAGFTAADYYFWRTTAGPRIYVVYKTNAGDSFRLQSKTAAVTSTNSLYGSQPGIGEPSTVLGSLTGQYSVGGESTMMMGAGNYMQGLSNFASGHDAGASSLTSSSFLVTPNGAQRLRGNHLIAIGAGITNGVAQEWKQISGIDAAGVITFSNRHGWPVGEQIASTQRNTTTPTNLIKQDGVNLPTAGSLIRLVVINSRQAKFYDLPTEDQAPPVFSITGNATEIEISRTISDITSAMALGRNAVLESFTMNFGSTEYTGGAKIRGGVLQNPDGGILVNSAPYVPSTPSASVGPAAQGYVGITAVPADGDTITANGTAFTFKTTPTASNTDVPIGASVRDCAYNFAAVFNAYDPNITASRTHRASRLYIQRFTAAQFRINFICQDYSGNTYTLAVSGTGLTVSGATLTGSNMGTTPAPTAVPNGTIVRIQHHPKQRGGIGLAMADWTNNRWQFL